MFEKIDSFCWQRYLDWPEIENWSDESSRIVLIGEASRPLIVSPLIVIPRLSLNATLYSLLAHRTAAFR